MGDPRIKAAANAIVKSVLEGLDTGNRKGKPVQEHASPSGAHKSGGPAEQSLEASRIRASLREDVPAPSLPFDDQIRRAERLKTELPVWRDDWRKLHVKNRTGMDEFPTLEEANLFPTVRMFDDHNYAATQLFDAAKSAFNAGKTSLANGDPAGAQLSFHAGQALMKAGLQHVKRNEQWQRMRLDHDLRMVDQKLIIEPSIDLMDNLAMETTFSAAGATFGAFRSAYRASLLARREMSAANAGRAEFTALLNDSARLAKTSPETLVSVSRAAGGEGLELNEARRLVDAAKLPGERARTMEQGLALRSEVLELLKNHNGPEEIALKQVLHDENKLTRVTPQNLVHLGRSIGLTEEHASLLIRSADLHRYGKVDALNWKKAIDALEKMGDKDAANELRAFINEVRGHHTVVSQTGRELNQTMQKMRGMSPEEMEKEFGITDKEAQALSADLKSLGNQGVHFTYHDLLSVGGKTNTRVARNMGKAVGKEDPNLKDMIELHNRCNDHHGHLKAAGGPAAITEARIETAVDLISAWRQERAYKKPWSWEKIDQVIEKPGAGDPWASDTALRGWLKVTSQEMKRMEKSGFPLMNPENYNRLQPGQFLYE